MTTTSRSMSVRRSGLLALTVSVALLRAVAFSAQMVPAVDQSVSGGNHADDEARIPSNLVLTPMLRPVVERMWRQSPTFKAQCARLRQVPSLLVEIRFGNPSQLGAGRGRTDFVRSVHHTGRAYIYIDLELRSVTQWVELIAHELEHVIEQLDEVDLTAAGPHGIYQTARGEFETVRAIHIGRKITSEVYDAMNPRPRAPRK